MPRAGLSTAVVVAGAAEIADEVGLDRLTLAMVAKRFGVALPSLYKHVEGLDALLQKVSALAIAELAEELVAAAAGLAGADALRAMAAAQRAYAKRHPGRYPAAQRVPDPAGPAPVAAGEKAVGVSFAVLRGYGFDGDDLIDATRAVRSAIHGFVTLEIAGGFGLPRDVDRSFERLVDMLHEGNRVAAQARRLRS
ncbi:TetR-like C-terminal domain-containing protein [Virgisporangium ochraceum]